MQETQAPARHEFLSGDWFAMFRAAMLDACRDLDLAGVDYSVSEEYVDAPAHLRTGEAPLGYTVRFTGSGVEVADHPSADATVRLVMDYSAGLEATRRLFGGRQALDDPERAARISGLIAAGRLRIEGNPAAAPPVVQAIDIHDYVAVRTG